MVSKKPTAASKNIATFLDKDEDPADEDTFVPQAKP